MAAARRRSKLAAFLRRLPDPTFAGHVALTFLVIGLPFAVSVRNNPLLLAICAFLATLVASFFLTWWAAGNLSLERWLPPRTLSGELFEVRVRITNRSRWRPAFGMGFRDALQIDSSGEVTCGPTVPLLAPGATVEVVYEKRIHRRGVYNVSNALVATRFPLGAFERRVLLQTPTRIVVLPPIGRLQRAAKRQIARKESDRARKQRPGEGTDEFHTLREYRPGDNPRLIHWRTTARVGTLVRRVMHDHAGDDIIVALDTRMGRGLESRFLESAISCAATLLVHAQKQGRKAVVFFPGGRAAHDGSRGGLFRALETLATLGSGDRSVATVLPAVREEGASRAIVLRVGTPLAEIDAAARQCGVRPLLWDATRPEFQEVFRR